MSKVAETALPAHGVIVGPDFIANAGGVICAATEYRGGSERETFDAIEQRIRANTRQVLEASRRCQRFPRGPACVCRGASTRRHADEALALTRCASAEDLVARLDLM